MAGFVRIRYPDCDICGEMAQPGHCHRCLICEEELQAFSVMPSEAMAEMHDPAAVAELGYERAQIEDKAGLVHAECGVSFGWEVS